MDRLREGVSVTCPPLLDGGNYAYWKARTTSFIKSLDERSWKPILIGCTVTRADAELTLKPEETWTTYEDKIAFDSSRALNAIFSVVGMDQIKLISSCKLDKEAWQILEIAFEGTTTVRRSKLQMLVSKFEDLRINEHETIEDFNGKLCDIANEAYALGEKYFHKALRSLPRDLLTKLLLLKKLRIQV